MVEETLFDFGCLSFVSSFIQWRSKGENVHVLGDFMFEHVHVLEEMMFFKNNDEICGLVH